MAKDVIVVVQRDAMPKEKENLDILLISTTGAQPVKVYRDVPTVEAAFGEKGATPNAKIVRKVTTLLNQGKTTLADTLTSKFKIVGFEPPSARPALPAKFVLDFTEADFTEPIATGASLRVKIGGDDKAVVELTTTEEIASAAQFAELFNSTSFTKGGKTYTATAEGGVVTYTATEPGAADSIPERLNIYTDTNMTTELELGAGVDGNFTNGSDAVSAPDALIEAIKKFQEDVDNDWYFFMTDRDEPEFVKALAKFAEASEPTEAELGVGVVLHGPDHRQGLCEYHRPRCCHLHRP